MKKNHPNNGFVLLSILLFLATSCSIHSQHSNTIKLLVRADDIGSSHAANRACIDAYTDGIARSVEVMVNCSWFPEAAEMLRQHPGYDAGVHLMLTSEWDNVKWRPLTYAPSLVDENGYFFPMVWPNDNYPPERTLRDANWKIEEIEQELRAQIEMAIKHIPQLSHISSHMGFTSMDPTVEALVDKLAKEYELHIDLQKHDMKRMPGWHREQSLDEKINTFAENIRNLTPGNYLFVEHPAYDEPEMRATFHTGYDYVAEERDHVTRIFTSPKVLEAIKEKGVVLVGYDDFRE
jgi:chitin disaccharide deacetylase